MLCSNREHCRSSKRSGYCTVFLFSERCAAISNSRMLFTMQGIHTRTTSGQSWYSSQRKTQRIQGFWSNTWSYPSRSTLDFPHNPVCPLESYAPFRTLTYGYSDIVYGIRHQRVEYKTQNHRGYPVFSYCNFCLTYYLHLLSNSVTRRHWESQSLLACAAC
jgi:hypothetical protein